jgi:chitinase
MFYQKNWIGYEDADSLKIKMDWVKKKGYAGVMNWAIDMDDFRGVCGTKDVLIDVLKNAMKSYIVPVPTPLGNDTRPDWLRPPPSTAVDFPVTEETPEVSESPEVPEETQPPEEPIITIEPLGLTSTTHRPVTESSTSRVSVVAILQPKPTSSSSSSESPPEEISKPKPQKPVKPKPEPSVSPSPSPKPTDATDGPASGSSGNAVDPPKLDCEKQQYYKHENCRKYYWCVHGKPTEMSCQPGLEWDDEKKRCDWPKPGSTCIKRNYYYNDLF